MQEPSIIRVDAGAIVDASGCCASPGSILLERHAAPPAGVPDLRVLVAGSPRAVDSHPLAGEGRRVDRTAYVLLPGLVNAHTHLDLTHIGPQPHDPEHGFVSWVDRVRERRARAEGQIAASVREGITLALAGGTVAIGDIGGAPDGLPGLTPWRTLRQGPLAGVSFVEFFAIGSREDAAMQRVAGVIAEGLTDEPRTGPVRLGLQPHATNTVGPKAMRWGIELAGRHTMPVCVHVAETPEEHRFIAHADGPQRELLERAGVWEDAILKTVGQGKEPVHHLLDAIGDLPPPVMIHVNDASDDAIRRMGERAATVVYCPRASAYFASDRAFGPHRYRDMMAAGVRVALGTDSLLNLPATAADPATGGISVLDEMRLLHRRDDADPRTLLAMATTEGARVLAIEPDWVTFASSPLLGLLAVAVENPGNDPMREVLRSDAQPDLLLSGKFSS